MMVIVAVPVIESIKISPQHVNSHEAVHIKVKLIDKETRFYESVYYVNELYVGENIGVM